jgi:hypothetical protein
MCLESCRAESSLSLTHSLCPQAVKFEKKPLCLQSLLPQIEGLYTLGGCSAPLLLMPALSIPLNGHSQGGWGGVGHRTGTVCLHSITRDSPEGVRRHPCSAVSKGQIFPTQAIMGGGGQGRGHSGTLSGAGAPHCSVFFRRRRRRKKNGCKHKLYFWEKKCLFPTCLFIYKPWEHQVPLPWVHCPHPHVLALCQDDPGQLLCPACLVNKCSSTDGNGFDHSWRVSRCFWVSPLLLSARPTPLVGL